MPRSALHLIECCERFEQQQRSLGVRADVARHLLCGRGPAREPLEHPQPRTPAIVTRDIGMPNIAWPSGTGARFIRIAIRSSGLSGQ